jgi:RHS repeat-associated protein
LKLQYDYQYGQLYRVRDFNSPFTNFWTANATNARNQITQETLGNGLVTNRVHDDVTGWLETIQTGLSGGAGVQNLAYEWDLVGNLKKRTDVNQSNLAEEFFYDNLYRLGSSKLNNVPNLTMAYDVLGNITSKSDVGSYTYHATKEHQVTSTSNGWSFAYDNNGNMTSGRNATITWTSYNYPASIANGSDTSSFSYTPDRQYWQQVSNYTSGGAATTIYVGGILEKVTTSAGTDYRHMIRARGASIIVSRQSSGTNSTHYVTSDHLGSSSAVTNSAGGVLVNSSFDAFGKRRGSNWSGNPSGGDWTAIAATTRRGYTDHTMLDNVGLIHMNGRVQDPVIGRFVSADPYVTRPDSTQGFNRYSYVRNNPLRLIDPSGFGDGDPGEEVEAEPVIVSANPTIGSAGGGGGGGGVISGWNLGGAGDAMVHVNDPFGGLIPETEILDEIVVTGEGRSGSQSSAGGGYALETSYVINVEWWDPTDGLQTIVSCAGRGCSGNGVLNAIPFYGAADCLATIRSHSHACNGWQWAGGIIGTAGIFGGFGSGVLRAEAAELSLAARGTTTVIGKVDDLKNLRPGEQSLLSRLPNRGSPQANWHQNSGVLRQEMGRGLPIRDATVDSTGRLINNTGFLRAERNLLECHGWCYNPSSTMWTPPVGP